MLYLILYVIFFTRYLALYRLLPLIPMLDVLFDKKEAKATVVKPIYTGISSLKDYYKDYLSYQVNEFAQDDASKALLLVVSLVIVLFFLKNIFNYLAMYFITFS